MKLYRQGDVPILSTHSIPETAKARKRDNGRVVLAYGEVTGHAHAIHGNGCALLQDEDGTRYLRVNDVALRLKVASVVDRALHDVALSDGTIVRFDDGQFVKAEAAIHGSRTLTVRGVLVQHEEHASAVIEPGEYILPGQREYVAPEIERRVAD